MLYGTVTGSFAFYHTLITLVAIASGLVVLFGLLGNRRANNTTAVFLLFSALTAVTGFLLPFKSATQPSMIFGYLLSVTVLLALLGRYVFAMRGTWRATYVVTAVVSLYLNCFVLVTQSFVKFPALAKLAPITTPGAPPGGPVFGGTQAALLVLFLIAGFLSVRRFHPRG